MQTTGDTLRLDDFTSKSDIHGHRQPRVYGEALLRAARADNRIIALGADLSASTETDLVRDALPDQFRMIGMAEANLIGVAAGMARCGDIPVTHTFSVFSTRRCFDQIAMQIAYSGLNVKLVGFLPGLTTPLGVSHQAIDDVALMRALPNMTVVEPSTQEEVEPLLTAALGHSGPVYLRMRRFNAPPCDTSESEPPVVLGEPVLLKEGADCVVFAAGLLVAEALEAAHVLAAEHGIRVRVVNVHTLKPLAAESVTRLCNGMRAVITAENHSVIGGLGTAIAEIMAEAGLSLPLRRVGLQDTFAEGGSTPYLFDKYGLTARSIIQHVRQAVDNGARCDA